MRSQKKEATTEIEVAESRGTGEAVSSGFRATCTTTATARTGAKSVGIVRPRDDVKYIAASSNATVAKSVAEGGSLPPWIVMFSVTAKCERAVSLGEAGHSWSRAESTPRQSPISHCPQVELGFLAQWIQQTQRLLVKFGSLELFGRVL